MTESNNKQAADKKAKTEKTNKKTAVKPKNQKPEKKSKTKPKKKGYSYSIKYLGGLLLSKMARGGAAELRSNADEVNKLNVFPVPDGDTGDNMRMTIESGVKAIENIESDNISEVMQGLSHGMLLGARGNSGVILSQFFAGIAKGFEGIKKADAKALGDAFGEGVKQAYTSVMTPTEGTILTVAREAVEYATSRITPESTIRTFFADLVDEMHASVNRTPEILAVLKEADVVDSGGAGLFYILDGFNRVLNGKKVKGERAHIEPSSSAISPTQISFGPDSEMKFGYCTEFLLQLQTKKTDINSFDIEALKAKLQELGDSIVAFITGSVVKVHIHTFTPEAVLSLCRSFGEFLTMKIENMSVQHTSLEGEGEKAEPAADRKKYGIVAVSNGEGITNLFRELGADEIVEGGQTNNPSTNDFLDAFDKINAESIFVFPNNSNILMAAQQAAELYEKAKVYVVPSKNIGTGYVALSAIDLCSDDAKRIMESMEEAIGRVTSGCVSPSIRDAEINGVHISKGDTIGIIEKEIVTSEPDTLSAVIKVSDMLLASEGKFMLSVFLGKDAKEDECQALDAHIKEAYPRAELYFIRGEQEIYPYIFVAE